MPISLLKEACKAEKSEFIKILVKNGSRLVFEGKNDKVNDLYILKLMVKRDYILSCYEVAGNLNQSLEKCNCGYITKKSIKSDYWNIPLGRFKKYSKEPEQNCVFHHEHFSQVDYFYFAHDKSGMYSNLGVNLYINEFFSKNDFLSSLIFSCAHRSSITLGKCKHASRGEQESVNHDPSECTHFRVI